MEYIPLNEMFFLNWKEHEFSQLSKRFIVDTLPSADIQKIVNIRGQIVKVFGSVIYGKNPFGFQPFKNYLLEMFDLRTKNSVEKMLGCKNRVK